MMNKTTKLEDSKLPEAGERGRDEKRGDAGPRYGGGAWKVDDERRKLR